MNEFAQLEKNGSVSLHIQIRNLIANQIRSGHYQPGDRLPSERELMVRLEVSRMTVRLALADLARSGLIYSAPGKGTFVAQQPPSRGTVFGLRREDDPYFADASFKLLEREVTQATEEDASELHREPGSRILVIRRLRLRSGKPIAIEDAHLPMDLCSMVLNADVERESLHGALRSIGLGPTRARYYLKAGIASRQESETLDIATGAPMLRTYWTSFLSDGTPIEYVRTALSGGSYEFEFSLGS